MGDTAKPPAPPTLLGRQKESALEAFYHQYAPQRQGTARRVLQKYMGRSSELYDGLRAKYGTAPRILRCVPDK